MGRPHTIGWSVTLAIALAAPVRGDQLDAIFALSADGFLSFDSQRRVHYASPAFVRLTGLSESLVLGAERSLLERGERRGVDEHHQIHAAAVRRAHGLDQRKKADAGRLRGGRDGNQSREQREKAAHGGTEMEEHPDVRRIAGRRRRRPVRARPAGDAGRGRAGPGRGWPVTAHVLVVDDEAAMRRLLRATLTAHGFTVTEAGTVAEAKRALAEAPALVILDLGLPDGDGLDLVRALRPTSAVPVIVISARDREADKIRALDAGADDYLTKPFGTGELLARMRVALRHAASAAGGPAPDAVFAAGPIRLDLGRHEVTVSGAPVHLTPIEFKLLAQLLQHAGKVLTHRHLLREVWGPGAVDETHYLRVHMAALRRKVEADPGRARWLLTEPGVGYRMRDGDEPAA